MKDAVMRKTTTIKKIVKGKTFADVGGLWGTKGEMVTQALSAGATRAAMIDKLDKSSEWWERFDKHCSDKGFQKYEKIIHDISAPKTAKKIGRFDVVHCSGVMYHLHDIIGFISNLLSISNEYLLVTSEVLPSTIENSKGRIHLDDNGAICVPYLSKESLNVLREYFRIENRNAMGITSNAVFFNRSTLTPNFGPWWWLFTAEFMSRLVSGFPVEIMDEGFSKNKKIYQILVRRL